MTNKVHGLPDVDTNVDVYPWVDVSFHGVKVILYNDLCIWMPGSIQFANKFDRWIPGGNNDATLHTAGLSFKEQIK